MNDIFEISGIPNNYPWGGYHFIPQTLGFDNTDQKPYAEYWLGAHPSAPSRIQAENTDLAALVNEQGEKVLGNQVEQRFGRLPFLFKILDVRDMLSIQVHPSKKGAEIGFQQENEAGVPQSSPTRNYKDDNHKPELMYALSEFWLLHGFLCKEDAVQRLQRREIYKPLLEILQAGTIKDAFEWTIAAPLEETSKIIDPLLEAIREENIQDKSNPEYWIGKWTEDPKATKIGLLVLLLMNVVKIEKGGAIFQGAGIIHAYLEGQNIELMANSDNVLRGGLTVKHMDFEELFKHTKFETTIPENSMVPATSISDFENKFPVPVEDFLLSEINVPAGETVTIESTQLELYLTMEGNGTVRSIEGTEIQTAQGKSFASTPEAKMEITASGSALRIFRAKANL